MSKKWRHPELRGGEVFLTNMTSENFHRIEWKTKRAGAQAYDIKNRPFKGLFPVFVQKSELDAAGVRLKR